MDLLQIIQASKCEQISEGENCLTVLLSEAIFYGHGYTEETLYADDVQDAIYEAVIDLYSNERMPVIFVEIMD